MSDIRLLIQKPLITEKGTQLRESSNRYVFRVDTGANKRQIKKAVEETFKVKVLDVRTANVPRQAARRDEQVRPVRRHEEELEESVRDAGPG